MGKNNSVNSVVKNDDKTYFGTVNEILFKSLKSTNRLPALNYVNMSIQLGIINNQKFRPFRV